MALFLILLQACMGQRLMEGIEVSYSETPFSQCNPFDVVAAGTTGCEEYFSKYPTAACNLNLQWHEICSDAIPEGMEFMRDLCPSECADEPEHPEEENDDYLAVANFLQFLADGEARRQLSSYTPQCNPGYTDKTGGRAKWWWCGRDCPGGLYWTDDVCNCACIPSHLWVDHFFVNPGVVTCEYVGLDDPCLSNYLQHPSCYPAWYCPDGHGSATPHIHRYTNCATCMDNLCPELPHNMWSRCTSCASICFKTCRDRDDNRNVPEC